MAKNNNKAVSDLLKIDDDYVAFCIDEAAEYVYWAIRNKVKPQESGNALLNKYAKRK